MPALPNAQTEGRMSMKSSMAMVAESMAVIKTLTVEEAARLHHEGAVLLVDIRDPREISRDGTIPGSKNAPRGMLEFWIDQASPYHRAMFAPDSRVVFFCASGWRSALATRLAQEMGMMDVSHIGGGFTAWRDAGKPVLQKS
jgi:rhodanese-related sulfurtransferase